MRRLSSVIAILAFTAAPALTAQEAGDTLPFRAHQWAFLFTGGSSFAGIGGLHFTAPNRATILNLSLNFNHSHQSFTPVPDTTLSGSNTGFNFEVRVGRRAYQPVRHDVTSYQTIGVIVGGSRACGSFPGGGSDCQTSGAAGLFGEIGAQYLLTPRLSVGGQVTASVVAQYGQGTGGGTSKFWSVAVAAGGVSFGGAIYF